MGSLFIISFRESAEKHFVFYRLWCDYNNFCTFKQHHLHRQRIQLEIFLMQRAKAVAL